MGLYNCTYVGPYLKVKNSTIMVDKEIYETKSGKILSKYTKFDPDSGEEVFIKKIKTEKNINGFIEYIETFCRVDYVADCSNYTYYILNKKFNGSSNLDVGDIYDVNNIESIMEDFKESFKDDLLKISNYDYEVKYGVISYLV